MAYNFQDIDPENIDFKTQSDDARKKRLALLAAVATGGASEAGLGDLASQALTERANKATERMDQIGQMLTPQQQTQPVGPVMPEQVAQQRQQEVQQPVMQEAQPVIPVQPQSVQQPIQQPVEQQVQQTQLPQPGPGVQVAEAKQAVPDWHSQLSTSDFGSLSQLASNKDAPEAVKQEAKDRLYTILDSQRQEATANKTIDSAMSGDKKAVSDLTKELTKRGDEGSILKAMLYSRLGLSELAKDEQQKLGAGVKYEAVVGPDNTRALIKYGADNMPLTGFDESGKLLSPESLAKFASNALPTKAHLMPSVHGSPVVNNKGEVGTLMYDPRTQANYVQVGSERRPTTGWTTMAQNVQNVYNQAQAGALGKGAGEGFTPQPMKPLPGAQAPAVPATPATPVAPVNPASPAAATTVPGGATPEQRIAGDIAGLQREIANTPNIPANQNRLAILRQELEKVRSQTTTPAAQQGVGGGGIAQQKANLEVETSRIKEEQKPAAEAKGKETAASIKKQAFADNAYPIVKELGAIIKDSTGSGLGAGVDEVAAMLGKSPKGAQAIAKLETFASPLVSMVPRFEGSQSDRDVQMYQKQAGDFANPKLPIATRLAALQGMVKLLEIYDKEGANDWGSLQGRQEKTVNGVTYVFDGKGWKPKK